MENFKIYDIKFEYKKEFKEEKIENNIKSMPYYKYPIYNNGKLIFEAGDTIALSKLKIKNQLKRFINIKGNSKNPYTVKSELSSLNDFIKSR